MPTNVPDNAMVLGTAAGIAIPLDTARPKFSQAFAITPGSLAITLPEDLNLVTVYGTVSYKLVGALTEETTVDGWTTGGFLAIPNVFYDMFLPRNVIVVSGEAGSVIINCLQKWASIANEGQFVNS